MRDHDPDDFGTDVPPPRPWKPEVLRGGKLLGKKAKIDPAPMEKPSDGIQRKTCVFCGGRPVHKGSLDTCLICDSEPGMGEDPSTDELDR